MTFFSICAINNSNNCIRHWPSHWPSPISIMLVCTVMYVMYIYVQIYMIGVKSSIIYNLLHFPGFEWSAGTHSWRTANGLQHGCRRLKVMSLAQQQEGLSMDIICTNDSPKCVYRKCKHPSTHIYSQSPCEWHQTECPEDLVCISTSVVTPGRRKKLSSAWVQPSWKSCTAHTVPCQGSGGFAAPLEMVWFFFSKLKSRSSLSASYPHL